MTKAEIVQLITRRLGDSTSSYFGDRAWDYFEQELYAILQSGEGFTTDEIQGLQTKYSFPAQMSNDGIAILNLSVLPRLKQIDKIEVNGRLSDSIASEEYKKITEHPFYQLSGNESKYYRIGNELRILSGILTDFADADEVNLGKGIVLNVANRVIPLLKAEIGMVVQ
jgi:hypothetical protein